MEEFSGTQEYYERLEELEEKFCTVGLSRREFVELCKMLVLEERRDDLRIYIAALQLPTERD